MNEAVIVSAVRTPVGRAPRGSLRTVRPETAWKVVGVTNSRAACVITTCTSAPRSRSRRTRSGLL